MALEVSVGPSIQIGQTNKATVVVLFEDRLHLSGAALAIKLVVRHVADEADADRTARIAGLARRLADQMSSDIASGRFTSRAGLHWTEPLPDAGDMPVADVDAGGDQ